MTTEVLRVNAQSPEPEAIFRAAQVLLQGGLVAFPTETVYGLGASAVDPAACSRIFEAKGRPPSNPVIVHVAGAEEARRVVAEWPDSADHLAARFWPGPLTLVLPKHPSVPDVVTAGGPTVAVRVPGHPVALALLRAARIAVAAPSANLSGMLSPTRAEHVLHDLAGRIDMVLDAGPTPGGVESTVLDLSRTPPRLLRPGLVTPAEVEAVIGPIERGATAAPGSPLLSPGMLPSHYAPRTPLECTTDPGRAIGLAGHGLRVGLIGFSRENILMRSEVETIVMPPDPAGYAALLYDALHRLDAAGVDRIVVELPPDTEEWLAVRDRLLRAADLRHSGRKSSAK
jgi:L-threonylcarbamoyladenylate synthase